MDTRSVRQFEYEPMQPMLAESVAVSAVQVGIVGMRMHQRGMCMAMGMRFSTVPGRVVRVLMVFVMPMGMGVDEAFMAVQMRMALTDMQPDPDRHHAGRQPESGSGAFRQDHQ